MDTEFQDEARHELERKALRNVRDLVDKLEDDEHASRRRTLRLVAWSIGLAVVVAAASFVILSRSHAPSQQRTIVSPERPLPPYSAPGKPR